MPEYYDEYSEELDYEQEYEYDSDDTQDFDFFYEALEDLERQEIFDLVVEAVLEQQENWNFDFLKFVDVWKLIDMFERFNQHFVNKIPDNLENKISDEDLQWYKYLEYLVTGTNVFSDSQLEQIHDKLYNNKFYVRKR